METYVKCSCKENKLFRHCSIVPVNFGYWERLQGLQLPSLSPIFSSNLPFWLYIVVGELFGIVRHIYLDFIALSGHS